MQKDIKTKELVWNQGSRIKMVLQVQQQQKPRTWRKGTIGRRKNLERWDPLIAAGVARYKGLPEDRLRRACVVYTGSKTESYTRLSIFLAVVIC
jgi:hypothetical protein